MPHTAELTKKLHLSDRYRASHLTACRSFDARRYLHKKCRLKCRSIPTVTLAAPPAPRNPVAAQATPKATAMRLVYSGHDSQAQPAAAPQFTDTPEAFKQVRQICGLHSGPWGARPVFFAFKQRCHRLGWV